MAIKLLNKLTPFWYTPKSERDEPKPTRYHLNPLSQPELFEMECLMGDGRTREAMQLAIRGSLIGWENQTDEDDKPVEFEMALAFQLPSAILDDLSGAIHTASKLTDAERKNLLLRWKSRPTEPGNSTAAPVSGDTAPATETIPSGPEISDHAVTIT